MKQIISYFTENSRISLLLIIAVIITGTISYFSIPKESNPEITVPYIYVHAHKEGYSSQDSLDLIAKPMERHFEHLRNLESMSTFASRDNASILLKFESNADMDMALNKVNAKVDDIQGELPNGVSRPSVREYTTADEPIMSIALIGNASKRYLSEVGYQIKNRLINVPSVLEVDMYGHSNQVWEIIVNPKKMNAYGVSEQELIKKFALNDRPTGGGEFQSKGGIISITVSGKPKSIKEVKSIVIRSDPKENSTLTIGDIADVTLGLSEQSTIFRTNGQNAVYLAPKKRNGYNIIEASQQIRALIKEAEKYLPNNLKIIIQEDLGEETKSKFLGLNNTLMTSILLVFLLSILTIGFRSALLVGSAIPLSMLMSFIVLYMGGWTLNSMVLFGLLVASGLLVDMSVVVVEISERNLAKGMSKLEAFKKGATRMALPIIASSLTTIIVFIPLGFWPGIVGKFMVYFPITMLIVLSSALITSLIFVPALGATFGKRKTEPYVIRFGYLEEKMGNLLSYILKTNKRIYIVIISAFIFLISSITAQLLFGKGVEFFPKLDTATIYIDIYKEGNLSNEQKSKIFENFENKIIKSSNGDFVRIDSQISKGRTSGQDLIGTITLHLQDWRIARPFNDIIHDLRKSLDKMHSARFQVRRPQKGPPQKYDIEFRVSGFNLSKLDNAVDRMMNKINSSKKLRDGFIDKSAQPVQWDTETLIKKVGMMNLTNSSIVQSIRLATSDGIKIAERNFENSESGRINVIVRFPKEYRDINILKSLRVVTPNGQVPIKDVSNIVPKRKESVIMLYNKRHSYKISANVKDGVSANAEITKLQEWFYGDSKNNGLIIELEGSQKSLKENQSFLSVAFSAAMLMMMVILVALFNSIYKSIIISTAVLMSISGVAIGLLTTLQPFSVVMTGLGIIALSGIIVNNNIVLVDTYNEKLKELGRKRFREAAVFTLKERLRPIMLTVLTTVISLAPAVFQITVDFIEREVTHGGPSIQITQVMSIALVFGIVFATPLTFIVTPCMLALDEIVDFKAFRKKIAGNMKNLIKSK